jgi:hypothetical protein
VNGELKDIVEEEDYVSKVGLVTLFLIEWQTLMPDALLNFLNMFVIKRHKYLLWA